MVSSSGKHEIPTRVYTPCIFVLSEKVFCQGMVVLLNPLNCITFWSPYCLKERNLGSTCCSFRDVMTSKNTGFDRLKITELFGPATVLKLREAKRKEEFHTITDFTLLQVLSHTSK